MLGAVRHGDPAARVAELEGDLGRREGRVHGDVQGAEVEDCDVHDVPLGTVLRQQKDAVAAADAQPGEALREARGALQQLLRREGDGFAGAVEGGVTLPGRRYVTPEDLDDGALSHGHLVPMPGPACPSVAAVAPPPSQAATARVPFLETVLVSRF